MKRIKRFVEEWAFAIWFTLAAIGLGWIAFHPYPPIYAVPLAKQQEAGCKPFATTGNIVISRCVTEQGEVLFVNNIGFMAVQP